MNGKQSMRDVRRALDWRRTLPIEAVRGKALPPKHHSSPSVVVQNILATVGLGVSDFIIASFVSVVWFHGFAWTWCIGMAIAGDSVL